MAAKPDLDDGWLPYAHELDAALAVADFTKGARIVLREVFAQIFGLAKAKSAALSPSGIAGKVGMMREHISRAVKELVDAGALVRLEDGTFRFIKDYESWRRKGDPRMTRSEIEYCRTAKAEAIAYARSNRSKSAPVDRNDPGNASTEDRNSVVTPTVTESLRDRAQIVTVTVPESLRSELPPYRNGRGIELENGEKVGLVTNQPEASIVRERASRSVVSIKDLVNEARALFGDQGEAVAREIMHHSRDILGTFGERLDCYLAAIQSASRSKTVIEKPHGWFLSVGKGYMVDGGPPPPPVAIAPRITTRAEKNKIQDAGFAAALAQIPEDY